MDIYWIGAIFYAVLIVVLLRAHGNHQRELAAKKERRRKKRLREAQRADKEILYYKNNVRAA